MSHHFWITILVILIVFAFEARAIQAANARARTNELLREIADHLAVIRAYRD